MRSCRLTTSGVCCMTVRSAATTPPGKRHSSRRLLRHPWRCVRATRFTSACPRAPKVNRTEPSSLVFPARGPAGIGPPARCVLVMMDLRRLAGGLAFLLLAFLDQEIIADHLADELLGE